MEQQWYVIHAFSGKEHQVKAGLENRAITSGLSDQITQVIIPSEKVSEIKSGKKFISSRKFYPGYIFVRMQFNDQTYYLVKETPGVIGFVGSSASPQPLSPDEISSILTLIEEKKEKVKPKFEFKIGEMVKVIDGPFANMAGVVEKFEPDKGKITVRVAIFGRETPVELEYWQVEKG
jgi:transcription termination/antitermination protein NusG